MARALGQHALSMDMGMMREGFVCEFLCVRGFEVILDVRYLQYNVEKRNWLTGFCCVNF